MDCGGHPFWLLRRVVIPPKDGTHGKVPSNTKRYRVQNYWWYRTPYAKSVLVVPSIHYIQNILYTFLYVRRFTHEESDWYNTYMSLLMHLGKYIRILLTCCESMWNLFLYIVTRIFSTQAASSHPTSHKHTLNLYRS